MNSSTHFLQELSAKPVMGVALRNTSLMRLDLMHPRAPGNKYYKLKGNLRQARAAGLQRVVTFGGAWSNHVHALADLGRDMGLETVGIIRGERPVRLSAMLRDAQSWGMTLKFVSRSDYRRREEHHWRNSLCEQFQPCYVIPEGGANAAGVAGCTEISALVEAAQPDLDVVALACGTGSTLAGISAGLHAARKALGIAVLKNPVNLERDIDLFAGTPRVTQARNWSVDHRWHCGGYARVPDYLRRFVLEFEQIHGIPLDPVYTGKLMYALYQKSAAGELKGEQQLVALHTGGLQGRRGFAWLAHS